MTSLIGQQFGNYRLTQTLGQGGFGEVYLGEHIHLGSKAAVKVLYTRLDEKGIQQFKQEAFTLRDLSHPHIIKILDFGYDSNNIPYLMMDFAPGGTLAKRHTLGMPVPIATVVEYMKQISEGLQYAHNHNIIHRDVKPENMLLGQNDTILLSDFGIARIVQTYSIGSAHVIGTFQYMSPEQGAGKAVFASDQYSLGIVAYQWLCGTPPFQGSNQELMIQHYMHTPPPFPTQLGIPYAVENVVMKALAKDPQQRFANIQEFASMLERASRGMPFQVPGTTVEQTRRESIPASAPRQSMSTQFQTMQDIDTLYRQGVEAYAKGDLERTEQLWQQVLDTDSNYGNGTLAPRMTKLKQDLHPIRVQRLRTQALAHSNAARWQEEINTWDQLLLLESGDEQAQDRRNLASRHMQYAWMYTTAQQFVRERKLDAAKTELTNLWREVPYYPDPAKLAPNVGLKAPPDYEQAKTTQQKRQSQEKQVQQKHQAQQEKVQARKDMLADFGGSTLLMWLFVFCLLSGVGSLVGVIAGYWTDQTWIFGTATAIILAPIAYVLSYRKVMTVFSVLLPSLLGIAATYAFTSWLAHLNYASSEVSHIWFVSRTLWIGRQFTFGLAIMIVLGIGVLIAVLADW